MLIGFHLAQRLPFFLNVHVFQELHRDSEMSDQPSRLPFLELDFPLGCRAWS